MNKLREKSKALLGRSRVPPPGGDRGATAGSAAAGDGRMRTASGLSSSQLVAGNDMPPSKKLDKLLDKDAPTAKRMKALTGYVEAQPAGVLARVFSENAADVFGLLVRAFEPFTVPVSKGKPPPLADLLNVIAILRRFIRLVPDLHQKRFQRDAMLNMLGMMMIVNNKAEVRHQAALALFEYVEVLGNVATADEQLMRLVTEVVALEPFAPDYDEDEDNLANALVLPARDGTSELNLPNSSGGILVIRNTGGAIPTQEESAALFRVVLEFVAASESKILWLSVLKRTVLKFLYPDVSRKMGVMSATEEGGFPSCPPLLQQVLVPTIVSWLGESEMFSALCTVKENLMFVLEACRQSFALPPQFGETTRLSLELFETWVEGQNRAPIMTENIMRYVHDFASYTLLALATPFDSTSVAALAETCTDILGFVRDLAAEEHLTLTPETWSSLLDSVLGAVDALLAPTQPAANNGLLAQQIGDTAVETLLIVLLRSRMSDVATWDRVSQRAQQWLHWGCVARQWKRLLVQLTNTVVPMIWGLAEPSPPGSVKASDALARLRWEPESANEVWLRLLTVLGPIGRINEAAVHAEALGGFFIVMELVMGWGAMAPRTAPIVAPPIFKLFGQVFFETCSSPDAFVDSKAIAIGAICTLMSRTDQLHPDDKVLHEQFTAHFLRLVNEALVSASPQITASIVNSAPRLLQSDLPGIAVVVPGLVKVLQGLLNPPNKAKATKLPAHVKRSALSVIGSVACISQQFPGISLPDLSVETANPGETTVARPFPMAQLLPLCANILNEFIPCEEDRLILEQATSAQVLVQFALVAHSGEKAAVMERGIQQLLMLCTRRDVARLAIEAVDSLSLLVDHERFDETHARVVVVTLLTRVQPMVASFVPEKAEPGTAGLIVQILYSILDWLMVAPKLLADPTVGLQLWETIVTAIWGSSASGGPSSDGAKSRTTRRQIIAQRPFKNSSGTGTGGVAAAPTVANPVRDAAEDLLVHMLDHFGRFPATDDPALFSARITEGDDTLADKQESLQYLQGLSMVSLQPAAFQADQVRMRMLVRDLSARVVWDLCPNVELEPLQQWENDAPWLTALSKALAELEKDAEPDPLGEFLDKALESKDDAARQTETEAQVEAALCEQRDNIDSARNRRPTSQALAVGVAPTPQPIHPGQLSHLFMGHMGHLDHLADLQPLTSGAKLDRSVRSLDGVGREAIKIGVIYVARGQHEQRQILRNSSASAKFDAFVDALGWPVQLESHVGYLGGLARDGSTGKTAPYYSTSRLEVVFHVTTRMPTSESDDQQVTKKRHVGNDHVHIVWCEDTLYDTSTITSQFNDAHLIVYPLKSGLFRIKIHAKEKVPSFGPLASGMVISNDLLAPLVRATAINANRAIRFTQDGYSRPCAARKALIAEMRARYLDERTDLASFAVRLLRS